MTAPEIDPERCNLCGICLDTCPGGVLVSGGQAPPRPEQPQFCIACGHCVAICPQGAVSHPALPASCFLPAAEQDRATAERLLDLMRTRRSTRVFRETPVDKEALEALVQAASLAPSFRYSSASCRKSLESGSFFSFPRSCSALGERGMSSGMPHLPVPTCVQFFGVDGHSIPRPGGGQGWFWALGDRFRPVFAQYAPVASSPDRVAGGGNS